MRSIFLSCFLLLTPIATRLLAEEPDLDTNAELASFVSRYCVDCHAGSAAEAEVRLDGSTIDWSRGDVVASWERVLQVVDDGTMPPEDAGQPDDESRRRFVRQLDQNLTVHSGTGGTVLRRLSRREYERTIRSLFGVDYTIPDDFPPDNAESGFDNIGESLILSPPLFEAYSRSAATVADELFPPPAKPVTSETRTIGPDGMAISYSSSSVRDGAMRLVAKTNSMMRSCSWPTRFEARASGVYTIRADLSAFRAPVDEPLRFELRARRVDSKDGESVKQQRLLAEWDVTSSAPSTFEVTTELYAGETPIFYFANAPLTSDGKAKGEMAKLLRRKFADDPRLLAAWQALEHGPGIRGGVGWERVKRLMADDELDLRDATLESDATKKLVKRMTGNPVLYVETISYQHFEEGPAIDVHEVTITGPLKRVEDAGDRKRRTLRKRFLGDRDGRTDEAFTKAALERFLTAAFRRPADAETVDGYWRLVAAHLDEGHRFEDGIHLAIRTALVSPRFLYRGLRPGELDAFDLASRLSYFLTNGPPDEKLFAAATRGELSDRDVLERHARRLLRSDGAGEFFRDFTGQWLDTRDLEEIMPDPRLGPFTTADREAFVAECERFFATMLEENRPMADFIDPDFTFTSGAIATKVYGLDEVESKNANRVVRVPLPRGGRYGGILGQAGVMMATANGVDTQPVLRGVWVLENVLGDPPPPPPDAVPAITPDTRGTKTVRDLLAAHASEASCARCHRKIDPLGFALENFDPIGRWRDHYPRFETDANGRAVPREGPPVDATGRLPDGTELKDVVDLKRYVVEHIDRFSACLGEKLLTYATGRSLRYAERKEVRQIVEANHEADNRFGDLVIRLIRSDAFGTK